MPLVDLFWTMLWVFLFVAWFWVVISVIGDIFRSRDMGGFAKALWVLFVIVIPWLGVLIYLIVRGPGMDERARAVAAERDELAQSYIREVTGVSAADEIKKLADLKTLGAITDAEFEAQKAKLLG